MQRNFFNYNALAIYFFGVARRHAASAANFLSLFAFHFSLFAWQLQLTIYVPRVERESEREAEWAGIRCGGAFSIFIDAEGATHISTVVEIEYEMKWN